MSTGRRSSSLAFGSVTHGPQWPVAALGAQHRVHPAFAPGWIFVLKEKDFWKMLLKDSKIHSCCCGALILVKQISVCFLFLDLQYKNVACQFWDTFM